MDSHSSSCSHDSESFIPSSNFEPPPPVDCILQKSHSIDGVADKNEPDTNFRRSQYATQPDGTFLLVYITFNIEFADVPFHSANPLDSNFSPLNGDVSSHDTFGSAKCFVNPHSPFHGNAIYESQNSTFPPAHLVSSSKILEISENIDPKRLDQLQKLLYPALSSRASVPSTNPTKANLLEFQSQVNTEFSSLESLRSIPHVTDTTSTRTTGSSSDLFKTDSSSGFREPLVPPRRRNVASTSTNTSNEENDNSPLLSFVLSLTIQLIPKQIAQTEELEFKASDFAKTITWQSRVRRKEESAADSISEAAKILADSFSDWTRESLLSNSNESHRCCSCTSATLARNERNANCPRISSSSSEYFVPCTVIPESSDLEALSDTALAPMGQSIEFKVINPETTNRTSTSSSEYFLPFKASSLKRKLNENANGTQGMHLYVLTNSSAESVLNETNAETRSVVISSSTVDGQNHSSTSSSEYLIPVKKSAMRMAKSANREAVDAVEMESQPKPESSAESVIRLQHQGASVNFEKRSEVNDPSIDSSQEIREPGTNSLPSQNEVQISVPNTPKPSLRSILRNRGGKSANLTPDANQQQMGGDSLNAYKLRTPRQVSSSRG
ncbi:unnamed protein product [Rodentolepis nana]|uniref:Uncharacterized protein n=1 Tax=Rodentolepis nana TaxID=102285 RepID=A0A0R3T5X0_RODNA|nr:unnamed protein product [Rodentolepis nana]